MTNEENNKRDNVKEKIILFVIGVLVGAVISTGSFFAYIKLAGLGNNNNGESSMRAPGGTPPSRPGEDTQTDANSEESDSSNEQSDQTNTPPAKPGDSDTQTNTPPAKPSDDNSSSNTNS